MPNTEFINDNNNNKLHSPTFPRQPNLNNVEIIGILKMEFAALFFKKKNKNVAPLAV